MDKIRKSIIARILSVVCALVLAVFIPFSCLFSPRSASAQAVDLQASEACGVHTSADTVDSASSSYALGDNYFAVAPFPSFSCIGSCFESGVSKTCSYTFYDFCFSNFSNTDLSGRACIRSLLSRDSSKLSGVFATSVFSNVALGYSYYDSSNTILNTYSYTYSDVPVALDPSTVTFLSFRYGPFNSWFVFYYMPGFDFSRLIGYRNYYCATADLPFYSGSAFSFTSSVPIRAYSVFEFSDSASHRLYFCSPLTSAYSISNLSLLVSLPDYFSSYIGSFSSSESYQSGYSAGYADGVRYGDIQAVIEYNNGYNAGQSDGYTTGFSAGVASANDYSFLGLIGAVIDAPVKAVTSLLDFEVLGFNMSTFALSLLTVCVVLKIVSLISGG